MGVIRRGGERERYPATLRTILAEEFHHEEENRPPDVPLIIIEPSMGNRSRVTVIWDNPQWEALAEQDRSAMILDSYADAFGVDADLEVMFAMGLTRPEARRLGII